MKMEVKEIGPCPRCGGPGEYIYKIEWPANEDNNQVLIRVSFTCTICGYKIEEEKIIMPVRALYLLKGLLEPKMRPLVEKIFLASNIRLENRS